MEEPNNQTINQPSNQRAKKYRNLLYLLPLPLVRLAPDKVIQQVSTQSAILAGFAFTSLTVVSFENSEGIAVQLFGIFTSSSIVLELLALYTSGVLLYLERKPRQRYLERFAKNRYVERVEDDEEKFANTYEKQIFILWLSYITGLVAFIFSVIFLAWIKLRPIKIVVTIISLASLLAMVYVSYSLSNARRSR